MLAQLAYSAREIVPQSWGVPWGMSNFLIIPDLLMKLPIHNNLLVNLPIQDLLVKVPIHHLLVKVPIHFFLVKVPIHHLLVKVPIHNLLVKVPIHDLLVNKPMPNISRPLTPLKLLPSHANILVEHAQARSVPCRDCTTR